MHDDHVGGPERLIAALRQVVIDDRIFASAEIGREAPDPQ